MPRLTPAALFALFLLPLSGCGNPTPEEALENAEAYLAEGDARAAIIELKNALQDNPGSGAARARLGDVQALIGDYPSALKEYERALDLGVDTDALRFSILQMKNRLGRFTEVIGELEDRTDLTPAAAVLLGEALLAAGDVDRAERYLRQGNQLSAGAIGLAQIEARRGAREAALAEAARAMELPDVATETVLAKGELELGYGLFDDAKTTFQQAAGMSAGQIPGLLGAARALLAKRDLDGALAQINSVLQAAPGALPAHYLKAAILVQQDDLEGAESSLREVQKVAPDHAPSMYLMALIKQKQGQTGQAEDQARRFLARMPNDPQGLLLLGGMLAEDEKFDQVVDLLAPASETTVDPQLLSMLGNAQLRTGRSSEATATLQRAVALAPDAAPVRNQLALSLVAGGDASAAEDLLLQALDTGENQLENEYLLAMLRLQKRDVAGAKDVIDRLMASNPELPLPYHLRGLLWLVEQSVDKAEAEFKLALEKDAGFLPAAQGLAQLALQRDDIAAAKAVLAEVLKKTPDDAAALVANAELASRDGDLEATEKLLTHAADKNPKAVGPRVILARLYVTQKRIDDAERMIAEGLVIAPSQVDLLVLKADLALARNDRESAVAAVEQLESQMAVEGNNAALLSALGSIQLRLGNFPAAEQHLQRSLAISEGKSPPVLFNLAQLHIAQSQPALARERLDALQALGVKGVELDLLAADVLRAEGKLADATEAYARLIAQGSRDALGRQMAVHLQADKRADAIALLQSWLVEHPDDEAVKFNLADLYMVTDQDKAMPLYESLAGGKNAIVLNNLAWLYLEKRDTRALDTARMALEGAPDSPDVIDTLGWILIDSGSAEEGVMHLRRAVQLKPNDATLLYHLGVGLARLGSKGEARITLERALALGEFGDRKAAEAELDALSE